MVAGVILRTSSITHLGQAWEELSCQAIDSLGPSCVSVLVWFLHIVSPAWWHQGRQTPLEARGKRGTQGTRCKEALLFKAHPALA